MKTPTTLEPHHTEPQSPETRPAETRPLDQYPQIDLDENRPSRSYWWVWLLVFAAIGFGCYKLYQFEGSKKAAIASKKAMLKPRSIPVVAATARQGNMPVYLQGLGTVTAFNTVSVKPRIDGQLISVSFKEGQFVNKGEVLAEIDPRPFQVALAQAEGNLAQAKGTLAKDQAALKDAQVNYVRDQQLYKNQIIAKQQLDTQLAAADQVRGSIEADQATIATAQAAIDSAKLNLTFTKITAPISGRIGLRAVDVGNIVHASDANGIAVITQLQPISVIFNLPEEQLQPVLERMRAGAKLQAEAYDRNMQKKLADGTLMSVDNQIDTATGTARLKAVFPNTNYILFPNQFVNVKLWLNTQRGVIIVPAAAIQRGPTGTFVYIVQDDGTVTVSDVKVGMTEGTSVSIDSGIKPGDKVVIDGAEKLTEGTKVTLRPAGSATQHQGGEPE
jgi:multidrug efflux system membrane fusion protein